MNTPAPEPEKRLLEEVLKVQRDLLQSQLLLTQEIKKKSSELQNVDVAPSGEKEPSADTLQLKTAEIQQETSDVAKSHDLLTAVVGTLIIVCVFLVLRPLPPPTKEIEKITGQMGQQRALYEEQIVKLSNSLKENEKALESSQQEIKRLLGDAGDREGLARQFEEQQVAYEMRIASLENRLRTSGDRPAESEPITQAPKDEPVEKRPAAPDGAIPLASIQAAKPAFVNEPRTNVDRKEPKAKDSTEAKAEHRRMENIRLLENLVKELAIAKRDLHSTRQTLRATIEVLAIATLNEKRILARRENSKVDDDWRKQVAPRHLSLINDAGLDTDFDLSSAPQLPADVAKLPEVRIARMVAVLSRDMTDTQRQLIEAQTEILESQKEIIAREDRIKKLNAGDQS